MFFKKNKNNLKQNQSGFSLTEVMITVFIIGLVTAIVVIRYGSFNSAVLLKNQAFEIALDVREAQVFSVSTQGEGTQFRDGYGLFFDMNTSDQQYLTFLDDGGIQHWYRRFYNDTGISGGDTITATKLLDPRFYISDLCVIVNNYANRYCYSGGDVDQVSIAFERPSYNAYFRAENGGSLVPNLIGVEIEISSYDGPPITRTISVYESGLIEVQ